MTIIVEFNSDDAANHLITANAFDISNEYFIKTMTQKMTTEKSLNE